MIPNKFQKSTCPELILLKFHKIKKGYVVDQQCFFHADPYISGAVVGIWIVWPGSVGPKKRWKIPKTSKIRIPKIYQITDRLCICLRVFMGCLRGFYGLSTATGLNYGFSTCKNLVFGPPDHYHTKLVQTQLGTTWNCCKAVMYSLALYQLIIPRRTKFSSPMQRDLKMFVANQI